MGLVSNNEGREREARQQKVWEKSWEKSLAGGEAQEATREEKQEVVEVSNMMLVLG